MYTFVGSVLVVTLFVVFSPSGNFSNAHQNSGAIVIAKNTAEANMSDLEPGVVPDSEIDISVPVNSETVELKESIPETTETEQVVPNTQTAPLPSSPKPVVEVQQTAEIVPIKIYTPKTEISVLPQVTKSPSFNTVDMLKEHNRFRKDTGVPALTWSPALAVSAQKWSETLKSESCQMRHDPNSQLGENIFWVWTSAVDGENLISSPKEAVTAWAEEEAFYDYATNTCLPGKKCGHYTQLVWANTTEVGCGVSMCVEKNKQTDVWVCRYSPHGNIIGLQPF